MLKNCITINTKMPKYFFVPKIRAAAYTPKSMCTTIIVQHQKKKSRQKIKIIRFPVLFCQVYLRFQNKTRQKYHYQANF